MTLDENGAQIFIKPEDLTRLFCLTPIQKKKDPLLTSKHQETIAEYINDQIVKHLKTKDNSE